MNATFLFVLSISITSGQLSWTVLSTNKVWCQWSL